MRRIKGPRQHESGKFRTTIINAINLIGRVALHRRKAFQNQVDGKHIPPTPQQINPHHPIKAHPSSILQLTITKGQANKIALIKDHNPPLIKQAPEIRPHQLKINEQETFIIRV